MQRQRTAGRTVTRTLAWIPVKVLLFVVSVQHADALWLHAAPAAIPTGTPIVFHCVKTLNPLGLYVDICREVPR
jgi:hypothetical protein